MANVLIIEDEEGIQHLLQRIVSMLGHSSVLAGDGPAALSLAREPGIDLIISDLSLPGKPTGIDFIAQLRALQPACPLIVATGYTTIERMDELRAAGVRHILGKPFEIMEARALIASLIGNARPPP